jgi:hypothetical protein
MDPTAFTIELVDPLANRPPGPVPYGVPRRFGVGTIMVVTAAFAGLLALMRLLEISPFLVGFWVIFISIVGVGQAVLFQGLQPRKASTVTGAAGLPLLVLVALLREIASRDNSSADGFACVLFGAVPVGAFFGYLAGGVAAGVFLVMDAVDKALAKRPWRIAAEMRDEATAPPAVAPQPKARKNQWRAAGYVTWKPAARHWVESQFESATPEMISKLIWEHLVAGGVIDQFRETRLEWYDRRLHFNARLGRSARLLDVEIVLCDDDSKDPFVHVVSVRDARRR